MSLGCWEGGWQEHSGGMTNAPIQCIAMSFPRRLYPLANQHRHRHDNASNGQLPMSHYSPGMLHALSFLAAASSALVGMVASWSWTPWAPEGWWGVVTGRLDVPETKTSWTSSPETVSRVRDDGRCEEGPVRMSRGQLRAGPRAFWCELPYVVPVARPSEALLTNRWTSHSHCIRRPSYHCCKSFRVLPVLLLRACLSSFPAHRPRDLSATTCSSLIGTHSNIFFAGCGRIGRRIVQAHKAFDTSPSERPAGLGPIH
jgi:hypothetical protein